MYRLRRQTWHKLSHDGAAECGAAHSGGSGMAETVTYRPEWRGAFERLNREWIETWFTLEEADRETFRDPVGKILTPGGQIFFVVEEGEVVGTCAVLRH